MVHAERGQKILLNKRPDNIPPWHHGSIPRTARTAASTVTKGAVRAGINQPTCFNCKQCHLTEVRTIGTRSLKEVREQEEKDKRELEREREIIIKQEEESVAAHKERMAEIDRRNKGGTTSDTLEGTHE